MKLSIKLSMHVTAASPEELAEVEKINAEFDRVNRRAKLDDSLSRDFIDVLKQLGNICNRADARTRRRRR